MHSPPTAQSSHTSRKALRVIACGALAREIEALRATSALAHISLTCLPAILHNHPERIAPAVDEAITKAKADGYRNIFVAYAECGTGGALDTVCERHGVGRIDGPHCYAFYAGLGTFEAWDEFDAFYLTDFLARQFKAFVVDPLKLDQHPELIAMMFKNYKKLVYLEQQRDDELRRKAQDAAEFLGLEYELRVTGFGELTSALETVDHAH
ncbi:MAG: DUF1638 domain-containing protein [Pseudomonadota bacterium]